MSWLPRFFQSEVNMQKAMRESAMRNGARHSIYSDSASILVEEDGVLIANISWNVGRDYVGGFVSEYNGKAVRKLSEESSLEEVAYDVVGEKRMHLAFRVKDLKTEDYNHAVNGIDILYRALKRYPQAIEELKAMPQEDNYDRSNPIDAA